MKNVLRRPMTARAKTMLIFLSALALGAVTLIGLVSGTIRFSLEEVLVWMSGHAGNDLAVQILGNVRMPRIITGILVGMNLGVAGVLLQGVLHNPMASPNIIGVNAGAGLAAVVVMTVFPGRVPMIPAASFLGALLTATLICSLSAAFGKSRTVHIVLAGIAVSNLMSAVTSGLMTINSDTLDITYSWLLGSLSGKSWAAVQSILPYSVAALALSAFISPKINLLTLGEEMAESVGLSVKVCRMIALLFAAVLAGSVVSVAGTIGFIGLIAPHAARLLVGNDHRFLVPLSALFGALLLAASDTIARTVFLPVELSVGIITSVLGAPFFLVLLCRKGKAESVRRMK